MNPLEPRHPDPVRALAEAERSAMRREGVPMIVALHDARPGRGQPEVTDARSVADGAALGDLFDHYDDALRKAGFPSDGPEADLTGSPELIATLVVLSHSHLRAALPDLDAET